ncbi:hypothetical protein [Microbispora triticiradicis]|nr:MULTISPECIES: hypothetical protein [Microbispora]
MTGVDDATAPAAGVEVDAERGGPGVATGVWRTGCAAAMAGAYSGEDP